MTVCVAALCQFGLLGASDRMITGGDVEFEPSQAKIWELTNSIALMTAGDSALQAEIYQATYADVFERIGVEKNRWWTVQEVAELYALHYSRVRSKRAERAVLAPLGLTHDTFISRQGQMADSFIRMVSTELINFAMPSVATIVAGTDPQGAHIYVVADGQVECHDKVGFASIGIGRWHANSQFMFAQHDSSKPFPETLLLTFAAKKRAEVSPGVGAGTDMYSTGLTLGSYVRILPEIVDALETIYSHTKHANQQAIEESNKEVNKYVEDLMGTPTPPEQEAGPKDGGGTPPADAQNVRAGTAEAAGNGSKGAETRQNKQS